MLPQPSALPRTRAKMRKNRRAGERRRSRASRAAPAGPWTPATFTSVTAIAAMPIGTLMKKIDCQPTRSVSTPPMSGPIATAAPVVAPQMPNAVPRCGPWKLAASSASEVANIAAPPTPCSARASSSSSGLVDRPQSSEARREQRQPAREDGTATEQVGERRPAVSSSAASESA